MGRRTRNGDAHGQTPGHHYGGAGAGLCPLYPVGAPQPPCQWAISASVPCPIRHHSWTATGARSAGRPTRPIWDTWIGRRYTLDGLAGSTNLEARGALRPMTAPAAVSEGHRIGYPSCDADAATTERIFAMLSPVSGNGFQSPGRRLRSEPVVPPARLCARLDPVAPPRSPRCSQRPTHARIW